MAFFRVSNVISSASCDCGTHTKNVMMSLIETLFVSENVCFDVVLFDITKTGEL